MIENLDHLIFSYLLCSLFIISLIEVYKII